MLIAEIDYWALALALVGAMMLAVMIWIAVLDLRRSQ
jgi:hypothetical protein